MDFNVGILKDKKGEAILSASLAYPILVLLCIFMCLWAINAYMAMHEGIELQKSIITQDTVPKKIGFRKEKQEYKGFINKLFISEINRNYSILYYSFHEPFLIKTGKGMRLIEDD